MRHRTPLRRQRYRLPRSSRKSLTFSNFLTDVVFLVLFSLPSQHFIPGGQPDKCMSEDLVQALGEHDKARLAGHAASH